MKNSKPSGPAIFMYCVIAAGILLSTVCFILYYTEIKKNSFVLWTGVTSFTITYHFWLRIIMGNITKFFKINYNHWWFKERSFEKYIYNLWQVKKWKKKALTYNPELFDVRKYSLEDIAYTMTKAETDHWINVIISVSTIAFGLIWGEIWIFILTAIIAILFDAQFIAIQRFNRPRVLKLIDKRKNKTYIKTIN